MRSVGLGWVFALGLGCAGGAPGPTAPQPPVSEKALPFAKAADARLIAEEQPGVARRAGFKGGTDLLVEVSDVSLGPRQSVQVRATGGAIYEVRDGRASVTVGAATREQAAGAIFTIGDGVAATVTNVGSGPLALHVVGARAP